MVILLYVRGDQSSFFFVSALLSWWVQEVSKFDTHISCVALLLFPSVGRAVADSCYTWQLYRRNKLAFSGRHDSHLWFQLIFHLSIEPSEKKERRLFRRTIVGSVCWDDGLTRVLETYKGFPILAHLTCVVMCPSLERIYIWDTIGHVVQFILWSLSCLTTYCKGSGHA
jgi:hypothetical protein